tara:strand:+ start:2840 stop:3070 length:231 start_codon:yes stop_codon:yes gene_type:complete
MHDYSNFDDKKLSAMLTDVNKKIATISRTRTHYSALPQMKLHQQSIVMEMRSRLETKKNSMYNQFWPSDSKIIGED